MDDDAYAGAAGRFYRCYIARPKLGRVVGRAVWGSDFAPLYRSLEHLRDLPHAATVLDAACGAGLALRWLDPARTARYVGVDHSPTMLGQARRTADRRGFPAVELHLADVGSLPVPDACADVGLLYNSLHCFADPEGALADVVRCLKPGAALFGSMLVRGVVTRADRLMAAGSGSGGMMGLGGTEADLHAWLGRSFVDVEVAGAGALAVFRAHAPSMAVPEAG